MKNLYERMLAVIKTNEPELAAQLCEQIANQHALDLLNGDIGSIGGAGIKDNDLMEYVLNMCSVHFQVERINIQGRSRERLDKTVYARHAFFWICRNARHTLAYSKMARFIHRNHATALHSQNAIEQAISTIPQIYEIMNTICSEMYSKGFEGPTVALSKIDILWNRKKFAAA